MLIILGNKLTWKPFNKNWHYRHSRGQTWTPMSGIWGHQDKTWIPRTAKFEMKIWPNIPHRPFTFSKGAVPGIFQKLLVQLTKIQTGCLEMRATHFKRWKLPGEIQLSSHTLQISIKINKTFKTWKFRGINAKSQQNTRYNNI